MLISERRDDVAGVVDNRERAALLEVTTVPVTPVTVKEKFLDLLGSSAIVSVWAFFADIYNFRTSVLSYDTLVQVEQAFKIAFKSTNFEPKFIDNADFYCPAIYFAIQVVNKLIGKKEDVITTEVRNVNHLVSETLAQLEDQNATRVEALRNGAKAVNILLSVILQFANSRGHELNRRLGEQSACREFIGKIQNFVRELESADTVDQVVVGIQSGSSAFLMGSVGRSPKQRSCRVSATGEPESSPRPAVSNPVPRRDEKKECTKRDAPLRPQARPAQLRRRRRRQHRRRPKQVKHQYSTGPTINWDGSQIGHRHGSEPAAYVAPHPYRTRRAYQSRYALQTRWAGSTLG